MGVRLAKISPTRGFAAELATALIITIAAQYGLPTSSSQCITGQLLKLCAKQYVWNASCAEPIYMQNNCVMSDDKPFEGLCCWLPCHRYRYILQRLHSLVSIRAGRLQSAYYD